MVLRGFRKFLRSIRSPQLTYLAPFLPSPAEEPSSPLFMITVHRVLVIAVPQIHRFSTNATLGCVHSQIFRAASLILACPDSVSIYTIWLRAGSLPTSLARSPARSISWTLIERLTARGCGTRDAVQDLLQPRRTRRSCSNANQSRRVVPCKRAALAVVATELFITWKRCGT
jgi:hypothetical protein